jgi:hypothetical protein
MFEYLFEKFNNFYENIFFHYGLFISNYYKQTITISFIINILLTFGLLKLNLLTDSDELYSVINSQAKSDEKLLKNLFIKKDEFYEKKFYVHQLIDFGTWGEINFHVKDEIFDKNIVNETYFEEIKQINDLVINNITIGDGTLKFHDLCAKRFKSCVIDGGDLLDNQFFNWLKSKVEDLKKNSNDQTVIVNHGKVSKSSLDYLTQDHIYARYPSFTDLKFSLGKNFKFITLVNNGSINSTGAPAYATMLKLRYALKSNYENMDLKVKEWEIEFLNFIKTVELKHLTFTYSTSQSLEIEMLSNISFDVYLISTTFMLITLFATLLMSFKSDMVTSPGIVLPFMGILSATFACTSSIGLLSLLNYPACNLIFVIPSLVLGK